MKHLLMILLFSAQAQADVLDDVVERLQPYCALYIEGSITHEEINTAEMILHSGEAMGPDEFYYEIQFEEFCDL